MATSKSTAKKPGRDPGKELKEKYKEYILMHGEVPKSVFLFAKELGMREEEFYNYFGSFEGIESAIWLDFMEETVSALKNEKVYDAYTSRERLLAFFYTLIERLKKDRSYVKYTVENRMSKPEITPSFLRKFRDSFTHYVEELIKEGFEKGEIVKRPVISDRYKHGLWVQLVFVIGFWLRDDSANFQNTDAAIEKSVNLAFDFMGEGPLEKMIDFAKFLYQNR